MPLSARRRVAALVASPPAAGACVAVVALTVRLAYLAAHNYVPGQLADADLYHTYAINLLEHGVFGIGDEPTAWVPPGLALVLAAVYAVFGPGFVPWAATIMVMNVAICCFIWDIARRTFGDRAALMAGLIAAVYPQFLFRTIHTDAKTLMQLGLCLGAWCLVREWQTGRARWLAWAGLAFGIAYLGRTQLVLLPAFLPVWAVLRYWPHRRQAALATAVVVACMLPLMLGWVARNYLAYGVFVAGSSGEGLPFASVNNEANYNRGRLRGLNMVDTAPSVFSPDSGYVDAEGHFTPAFANLPVLEQDRLLKAATFRWIVNNPEKMAVMVLFKWKALWISPQSFNWPYWSRVFNYFLYLGVVLPFFIVGCYRLLMRDRELIRPLAIWFVVALYITLLHSVFEGELRHRIAFEPGMIVIAAGGLMYGAAWFQERRRARSANDGA